MGVLLSIPFAPPWDAGIRPYAVTIPFQAFLAASGLGICLCSLLKWLKVDDGTDRSPMPTPTPMPMVVPASLLALLVLSLTFVLPVIHARGAVDLATSASAVPGIRFIPGSSVMLDVVSARLMQSGLSSIASCFRGEVKALDLLRPGCLIGINWNDLGRYAALPDATAFKDYGRITTDVRLLPR
jgi:hypothetical protein